jgi:type I restriction enzyme, S subunit
MKNNWQSLDLKEFSRLTAGGTPSTNKKEYWSNGKIPWLSSGEVHKKRIHNADGYITEEGLKNSAAKIIPKKTLLVALAGQGKTRGAVAITEIETTTNQSVAGIIVDKEICNPDYLFFNLESRYEILRSISGGSGRAGLNLEILGNLDISLPPLPEQKKIVSILTSVDDVIEITQNKIDKLQNLKKAIINELMTQGIGHTEFKESELGRIPKNWEVSTIGKILVKIIDNRGKTPPLSEEGRELIELASISKSQRFLNYNNSKKRVNEEIYKNWFRNGHPQIGDILVPTVGLIGECSIVSEDRGCIAQNVIALRCSDKLLSNYLYWLMYSKYVLLEINRVLMGAVQPSLKVPHLLETRIPIPPVDEQVKIFETLNVIENSVIDNQKKIVSFKYLKKSLMQNLLTGKVRVKVN